jgi:hypothetical protein
MFLPLHFSKLPSLHHLMLFPNISCSTFNVWCFNHHQQFTVSHNTQPVLYGKICFGIKVQKFCAKLYFLIIHFIESVIFFSPPF